MEKDIEMQKLEEAIHKYECAASQAAKEADEYADALSDADLDVYARTVYNDREKLLVWKLKKICRWLSGYAKLIYIDS